MVILKQLEKLVFSDEKCSLFDFEKTASMSDREPVFLELNIEPSASEKPQFFKVFEYTPRQEISYGSLQNSPLFFYHCSAHAKFAVLSALNLEVLYTYSSVEKELYALKLMCLFVDGDVLLRPNDIVKHNNVSIGKVTSAAYSFALAKTIAFAAVRLPCVNFLSTLHVHTKDNIYIACLQRPPFLPRRERD